MLVLSSEVNVALAPHRYLIVIRVRGPSLPVMSLVRQPIVFALVVLPLAFKAAHVMRLPVVELVQVYPGGWLPPPASGILKVLFVVRVSLSPVAQVPVVWVVVSWVIFLVVHIGLFIGGTNVFGKLYFRFTGGWAGCLSTSGAVPGGQKQTKPAIAAGFVCH